MMMRQGPVRRGNRRGVILIVVIGMLSLLALVGVTFAFATQAGLETVRRLTANPDIDGPLRAAVQISEDVVEAARRTAEFGAESLRTGSADRGATSALKGRYTRIYADAADLEAELRDVERTTTDPAARRVLCLTLQSLSGVKVSAAKAVELLDTLDPDD